MNILWITNKYVEGKSLSRYYPDFLKFVEENVDKSGNKISFIFFSNAMVPRIKSKNNFFFDPKKIVLKNDKLIKKTAAKLEDEYQFTFKQAYFPDLIQVSKNQDFRKIHLTEKEFSSLGHLVHKFLFLENIIDQKKLDVVFCDQSPEVEMELARVICLKKKKIFLRQTESFLGRCVFHQQFAFGKEKIVLATLDKKITRSFAKNFVNDFARHNRPAYPPVEHLKADFKEFYLQRLIHFYKYPQFIKLFFLKPYFLFEEKILKTLIRKKFYKNRPYFFFGFHLPTESTVSLRALPYMNQFSLIESISRVLPFGYYLYVREHPGWRKRFSFSFLKKVGALPCVRLISPDIPISDILKSSRGILTYNATTGIEALMYGKPILSFAPNLYHNLHPAADYCSDLYNLGMQLSKLANASVNKKDTYEYIYKMLRSSSRVSIRAGTFLSKKDSVEKASVFAKELLAAIEYCEKN